MSILFKRFFAVILSFLLIISVCLSQSISVRAEIKSYTWDELKENAEYFIIWAYSQMGAVFKDHDFAKFLANEDGFNSYFNQDHVSVNNGSITIDKEFMQWLKNWLINYSKQEQTYYYVWSSGFYDIPYSVFNSQRNVYDTVYNVLKTVPGSFIKFGISSTMVNGEMHVYLYMSAFDDLRDTGFVRYSSTASTQLAVAYSLSSWERLEPDVYCVDLTPSDSAITSWDDFKNSAIYVNRLYDGLNFKNSSSNPQKYFIFASEADSYRVGTGLKSDGWLSCISLSRTTFRVFRDTDYLFDYSLDKRGIYFTSDFWDYEPSDFTGTLDDLNNSIDRMDDILKRLLDKIDNTTDEKTIEDLLKQILDEIKNNGSGNGSDSSGSGNYDGFFGTILEYLDIIVDYLAGILDGIENLVFLEWTNQEDNNLNDLNNLWKGIKDDPETGSQAAADVLTTSFSDLASGLTQKFPFSIPWDLYALFSVFSEVDSPQAASISTDMVLPYTIRDGDVQPITIDMDGIKHEVHDAPYFKLPLKVESFGIYEEIIVDMKDFGTLSTLSRTLFSLIFAVFLLKFTIKILSLFRGGDGD